jgi:hypothetical protein
LRYRRLLSPHLLLQLRNQWLRLIQRRLLQLRPRL